MQEKPSKACFRTTRGLDAADAVHSCFFSEGVFRGALKDAAPVVDSLQETASSAFPKVISVSSVKQKISFTMGNKRCIVEDFAVK